MRRSFFTLAEGMKRTITALYLLGVLAILTGGCVSVRHLTGGMGMDDLTGGTGMVDLKANGNTSATIQAEIQSKEFVALLARRTGWPEWRVRMSLPVVQFSESLMATWRGPTWSRAGVIARWSAAMPIGSTQRKCCRSTDRHLRKSTNRLKRR